MDEAELEYVYYESPGTVHEWLTWRRDLYQFAQKLFKK
jgi:enterochelin esterase-like enzyme